MNAGLSDAEIIASIEARVHEAPDENPHQDGCLGGGLCGCFYEPDPDLEMERRREGL